MEGAAPNKPAKLLGRKISASTAKAVTVAPPTMKRRTDFFPSGKHRCVSSQAARRALRIRKFSGSAAFAAKKFVFLAFQSVVIDKKVLEFTKKLLGQVLQPPDVRIHVIGFGNGHKAIVADLLLAIQLLAFNNSDQPRANGNARECRFIHQQKYVVWGSPSGARVWGKKPKS